MHSIIPLDRIEREARAAAAKPEYIDVNDACWYDFATDAGRAFKTAFIAERARLFAIDKQKSNQAALANQAEKATDWSAA